MNRKREIEFLKLATTAHDAGLKAANECTPIPMTVVQHTNMMDDNSPVEKKWHVPDGVCGFAWVVVKPATSSFARWAKKNIPRAGNHYYGGISLWCPLPTQSMTRKEAYCAAYANILSSAGINAYMQSRID